MLLVDGVTHHPKLLQAGAEAAWLWVCAIDYARRHLTDGFVPKAALPTLLVCRSKMNTLVSALVTAGLFEPVTDGWRIHDYLQHNDSRVDVAQRRREIAQKKAAYRRMRQVCPRDVRDGQTEDNTGCPRDVQDGQTEDNTGVSTLDKTWTSRARVGVGVGTGVGTGLSTPAAVQEIISWRNELFLRLSTRYPNKDRMRLAREAWDAVVATPAEAEACVSDVERRLQAGWLRLERRFVPQLHRFLTERQWEDPVHTDASDADPWSHLGGAWVCRVCGEYHEGNAEQYRTRPCLKAHEVEAPR